MIPTQEEVVKEGDVCPACSDGVVRVKSLNPFYMECTHCHARWNDRGQRITVVED